MEQYTVQWSRLIRYENKNGDIRYGEPILEDLSSEEISKIAEEGRLRVRICEGSDAISASPTSTTELVKRLLGPLTPQEVPIIRCIGLNYKSHILETGRDLPENPTMFTKPSPSVADHSEGIPIPRIAQAQADYEGELVIVIGKDAKNVNEENALDYVAAYTVGNDISARDWQREPSKAGPIPQWSFSKSFDRYAPLGPCLVSVKLLGEANSQKLRTIVNGETRQEGITSDLCFGVKKLVAFCSQGQTLQRGSLIMTGTPGGVGLFMKPPKFLKHADVVEVEIEGIGKLRNIIVFE